MSTSWNWRSGVTDPYNDVSDNFQDIKMVLKTAPTQTIVSKAEAKNYMKLSSDTTDDDLVEQLINGATAIIERELGGLAIYEQTWKQYQKGGCETIELLRQPVIGTPTVSYYDDFDTVTATNITATSHFRVLENELYHADGYFKEGRDGDGYVIEYDVGMFTASNYTSSNDPRLDTLKTAILRTVALMYEQREENVTSVSEGNWKVTYNNSDRLPEGILRLIMPLHVGKNLI